MEKVNNLQQLNVDLTDELHTVLRTIVERIAANDIGKLSTLAGLIDSPRMAQLVESLLRSHPTVDLIREELGLEWKDRKPRGRPKKSPVK